MAGNLKLEGKVLKKAENLLKRFCEFLDKHEIPYVLEGGTLLGVMREKRLLPWDNDMDITVTEEYGQKLLSLRKEIWKIGFRVRERYHNKDLGPFKDGDLRLFKISTRKFYFFKDLGLLDIFVKKKENDKYFWVVGINNPVLKSVDARYYENFTTVDFQGSKLSIPKDYDDYLTCRYGDWRTPVKEWNFKKDDKAIVK
ncbi:MAG: LicD family protein [Candidatus Delongbacteria bacterium]|nr:LicD family protein [Candidatus Delongbacteria bacterium]MBN2835378.1 LicD family protein [Candidatus Delongbacteria bacterium]